MKKIIDNLTEEKELIETTLEYPEGVIGTMDANQKRNKWKGLEEQKKYLEGLLSDYELAIKTLSSLTKNNKK